ncbi:archaemetzincin family Zn-dependent metalloprotease [Haladaptatus sp. F3-133]|uniref:Archaemetzincin family Zn-dependent metalloprotease n=1 Tax=Halorutilus salinus TaxID=2487751 RepID=A0A9Q4C4T9_9EURY|nr:archaemetzincin family Zn-dependent metalloprotease [Halorutilus salinus]MCX2819283.1 archaemetzincin family Zn-dependent metalloprotease [Halorutilus salinus]
MRIDLVPVGELEDGVVGTSREVLRERYGVEVVTRSSVAVPDQAYDRSSGQYNAERIIDVAESVGHGDKNLAVTDVDIFYRQRNFVFGLAYLDGRGCVVSTNRLRMTADGGHEEDDGETFFDRVRKEVVHEVGHTLGLRHCDKDTCVMSFSPTVREVDQKYERPCRGCSRDV